MRRSLPPGAPRRAPSATLSTLALAPLLVLAGCVAPEAAEPTASTDAADPWALLSPILFPEYVVEHAPAKSFDGTIIDNWVFRPKSEGNDSKFPVIINFSPYWANLAPPAALGGDAFSRYLIDFFLPRGYAIVLSSARGTGHSHGCFTIGGEIEMKDTAAMIEHFAAMAWSTGKVAAGGKSYDGTMPHGALVLAPPSLKTIIPVSGISELYKYNYVNGVPYGQGRIFNAYYVGAVGLAPPSDAEITELPLLLAGEACAEQAFTQAHGVGSGASGDYTDYWVERNYTRRVADNLGPVDPADKPSVFFIHGLADWNVKPDHILPWTDELRAAGITVKMLLGQWEHEYPTRGDWNLTMLRWLDHELKGIDTGIMEEPLVNVEDNRGQWRTETEWPPARATTRTFHLQAAGELTEAPPSSEGSFQFRDGDAAAILPFGSNSAPDSVWFETEPLVEDLHLAGVPTLTLTLSHSAASGQVVVTLWDVGPHGETLVENWGIMSYRHRASLEHPEPVRPGEVMTIRVPFYPQDDYFAAGHRLAISIAASGGPVAPVPSLGTTTVHLGGANVNALELPALATAWNAYETPQPTDVGCWAC